MSTHAYDSTWHKFEKHIARTRDDVCLVFYIKDHHLYPILDDRLKKIATQANQGGADNLWKYISDMTWNKKSSKFIVLKDLEEEEELDVSDHVIVLPPETKIKPVIDQCVVRSNYFVEYLHFDNSGRLDGFLDHKNNMYVLKSGLP